eukprot:TRINITY_DN775927_c0_g1_i1.p1 TRINITY_DN775927_c0_g1~~TRINITY_DN775927_c0_g1_i1.p1  ORF type:complete len:302 (+),score=69.17 TRINITY_DN775927_c0_g1_i1:44-949(+)
MYAMPFQEVEALWKDFNIKTKENSFFQARIAAQDHADFCLENNVKVSSEKLDKVQKVKETCDEIDDCLNMIHDEKDWKFLKETSQTVVHHKKVVTEDKKVVWIKLEGPIQGDIQHLISLFYEHDCYSKWIPFMGKCSSLEEPNEFSKVLLMRSNLPFLCPFSNRDLVASAKAIDLLEEQRSILLIVKPVRKGDGQTKKPIPDPESGYVRSELVAYILLTLNSKREINFKGVFEVDGKVKFVPDKIVHSLQCQFSYLLLKRIRKYMKTIAEDKDYVKNSMASNASMYARLQEKVEALGLKEE